MKKAVLICRIILALIILIILAKTTIDYANRMISDYNDHWYGYVYYIAHDQMYRDGVTLESIPEHSFNGFPSMYYFTYPFLIAALVFVLTKICVGFKSKPSIISAIVVLVLLELFSGLASLDYYQNYNKNVYGAYLLFGNSWYKEDNSYTEEEWLNKLEH